MVGWGWVVLQLGNGAERVECAQLAAAFLGMHPGTRFLWLLRYRERMQYTTESLWPGIQNLARLRHCYAHGNKFHERPCIPI